MLKTEQEKENPVYDNRIPGVLCPHCSRPELVKTMVAGAMEPFCRKCLKGSKAEDLKCPFCTLSDHSNCTEGACRCEHGAKSTNLFEGKESSRKIRHSFEQDSEWLKKLLEEGKSSDEIRQEMDISSATLYSWKKKLGMLKFTREEKSEPNGEKTGQSVAPTDENEKNEQFLKLYYEGKSDPEIADIMGVSHGTPWVWRRKLGLASNGKTKGSPGPHRSKNEGSPEKKEDKPAQSKEEETVEVQMVKEHEKDWSFYLDLAERLIDYLDTDYHPSLDKFREQEKEREDWAPSDIDVALEIAFRLKRLGVTPQ